VAFRRFDPTEPMTKDSQLEASVNQAGVDFAKKDAACGLTFAEIALKSSDHSEARSRNKANARKAYDAVTYWRQRLRFSEADAAWLDQKLAELRSMLESMGEKF
jgi:hypothetical protein